MQSKLKRWLSIALRAALLVCGYFAVRNAVQMTDEGLRFTENLLYFTYQSNVWAILLTIVYLALGIRRLRTGASRIPRWLATARFAIAVAITITMIVFWSILAPTLRPESLMAINNQLLHTIVPLLFITDFLLFDRDKPISKRGALWGATLPLYYLIFSLTFAAVTNFTFPSGGKYPYYFLNLNKYGWFGSEAGMGVFWWLLIILGLTLGLSYLYRFLQLKTYRPD